MTLKISLLLTIFICQFDLFKEIRLYFNNNKYKYKKRINNMELYNHKEYIIGEYSPLLNNKQSRKSRIKSTKKKTKRTIFELDTKEKDLNNLMKRTKIKPPPCQIEVLNFLTCERMSMSVNIF